MVTTLVGICEVVKHTQIQVLACGVQLLGWRVVQGIENGCGKCKGGLGHPLSLGDGCWSWATVLVLAMDRDVFDVNVPGLKEAVRCHEARHHSSGVPAHMNF